MGAALLDVPSCKLTPMRLATDSPRGQKRIALRRSHKRSRLIDCSKSSTAKDQPIEGSAHVLPAHMNCRWRGTNGEVCNQPLTEKGRSVEVARRAGRHQVPHGYPRVRERQRGRVDARGARACGEVSHKSLAGDANCYTL